MKDTVIAIAIFAMILLFTPLLLAGTGQPMNNINGSDATMGKIENFGDTNKNAQSKDKKFKIVDGKTGKESTIGGFEFMCSIVAGEMPSEYDEQALKAQAVTAFSYCCSINEHGGLVRTNVDVAVFPRETAQKQWGSTFQKQWSKIEKAVREVYGKALFYKGEVIEANYSSMSSGITENNKDVFGNEVPYLVEVASPGDKLEKDYETRVSFTTAQFQARVKTLNPSVKFDRNPEKYLTDIKRSGAGGVLTATLCGKTVTGRDIRSLFDLRSTNFTISYEKGKFTFDVKGYGHGVGMSQCGAQYMAKQGKTWQDIVKWYFKGIDIGDYKGLDPSFLALIKKSV